MFYFSLVFPRHQAKLVTHSYVTTSPRSHHSTKNKGPAAWGRSPLDKVWSIGVISISINKYKYKYKCTCVLMRFCSAALLCLPLVLRWLYFLLWSSFLWRSSSFSFLLFSVILLFWRFFSRQNNKMTSFVFFFLHIMPPESISWVGVRIIIYQPNGANFYRFL